MAVLVYHRPQGIERADYDKISPPLVEKLKQQPGFIVHVAFEDSEGFCVADVWDSQEQYEAWFNENVVPNIPAEIKREVVDLHAVERL